MILFKITDVGGIGQFSVKHQQSQPQIMQIALFVGMKQNCLAKQGVRERENRSRGRPEGWSVCVPCYSCICQNGVNLFLFYILSPVHKAINGFINKSVLVTRMRLLRKWNRKSLSSPASKIDFFFPNYFSYKAFVFWNFLSFPINHPPPLCFTLSFDACDLYCKIIPLTIYRQFSHLNSKIPAGKTFLVHLSSLWNVAQGQQNNRHTGK